MKKFLSLIVIGFTTVISADLSLANNLTPAVVSGAVSAAVSDAKLSSVSKEEEKSGFFYVRFAAAETNLAQPNTLLPGLGIGYRRLAGSGAADISLSGIGGTERKNDRFFWAIPKTSYLHYLTPNERQSFYLGGGLAWGGVESKDHSFVGIIPSLTWGCEFVRKSSILGFAELHISQPAAAISRKGKFPGPNAELTVGMGF